MKIITCASYFGSGSSAVTDLVSEYSSVHPNTEFEFRFIHDPDGISDLEYHLVENHNRECSGYALKRFIKFSRFNSGTWFNKKYERYFHGNYRKYTQEYVDKLTDFSFKGFWQYDLAAKGRFRYYFIGVFNKIFIKLKLEKPQVLPKEITYCSNPGEEKFLALTQEYVSNLMECLNEEKKPYMVIDQVVPSSNIDRCTRYFKDDIYTIVIDRDPRDIYMLCKTIWRWDHIFPHDSVETWCKWFRYVRESASKRSTSDKVLYLQFEDFIYHYNDVKEKIEKLTGLDPKDHTLQFSRMNPKRSFHNTQIWKRNNKWAEDIKKIEELLPEYLYDFKKVKEEDVVGVDTKETGVF